MTVGYFLFEVVAPITKSATVAPIPKPKIKPPSDSLFFAFLNKCSAFKSDFNTSLVSKVDNWTSS